MPSTDERLPTPSRSSRHWRRYARLVATNFVRGASYSCGTAAVGLVVWWVQNH